MKALVVYASVHHGNTRVIARAIAGALGAESVEAAAADPSVAAGYDLLGVGSGIYFWKHHRKLLSFIDALPDGKGKKAFIFSTSGLVLPLHPFHRAARARLRRRGYSVAGEFSCRGFDTVGALRWIGGIAKGHPDDEDVSRAEGFGRALRGCVNE